MRDSVSFRAEVACRAAVAWCAEDIQTLRPGWSDAECIAWLEWNADVIQTRMIERGWDVIHDLLLREEDDAAAEDR
jgi:hypothetical protein